MSLLTKHDKALALLKSLACECDQTDEHDWHKCRACLAQEELGHKGVKLMVRNFLAALYAVKTEDDRVPHHHFTPDSTKQFCVLCGASVWGIHRFQSPVDECAICAGDTNADKAKR
jgi:hypothetical protein